MYEIKRGKGEEIMNNENYTFDIMRECYLKIMDCIESCNTPQQLISCCNMIETFEKRFYNHIEFAVKLFNFCGIQHHNLYLSEKILRLKLENKLPYFEFGYLPKEVPAFFTINENNMVI